MSVRWLVRHEADAVFVEDVQSGVVGPAAGINALSSWCLSMRSISGMPRANARMVSAFSSAQRTSSSRNFMRICKVSMVPSARRTRPGLSSTRAPSCSRGRLVLARRSIGASGRLHPGASRQFNLASDHRRLTVGQSRLAWCHPQPGNSHSHPGKRQSGPGIRQSDPAKRHSDPAKAQHVCLFLRETFPALPIVDNGRVAGSH